MRLAALDFETHAIVNGSPHSPKPVGLAVMLDGAPAKYYAFGHRTANNCTFEQARDVWRHCCESYEVVMHNAKFDVRVGEDHFGVAPTVIHDTMIEAFLVNPHFFSLALKPLSAKLLNLPPDEADELGEWIVRNVAAAKDSNWGAFIAHAPGDLVGKYAKGDVLRTMALHKLLYAQLQNDGDKT